MKTKKKTKPHRFLKVILTIFGGILVLICAFFLYLNIAYSEVDGELRFVGFVYDLLSKFDDEESLQKLSSSTRRSEVDLSSVTGIDAEIVTIETTDGDDMEVVIYRNTEETEDDAIGLLWIHGGGYAMNSAKGEAAQAQIFIEAANTVVVSPEYTLSVDEPYPAALNDCYDALVWMTENAEEMGINPDQIFIGGGSAGGGMTAALTLYARDMGEVNVAFQMPLYPMLNDKMDTASATDNHGLIWDSVRNEVAWQVYLGDLFGTDDVPKYASAARETDYSGLPPTFTYVGTLDPFYDDTINYVSNLQAAGIDVEFYTYEGAYHGFDFLVPTAQISQDALSKLTVAYQYAAEHYFAGQE